MWLWLLSCFTEPELHPKLLDRQYYEQAMQLQGKTAVTACNKIIETDLQGECILFAAKNMAHHRKDSRALCEHSPTDAWKQACRFDVIDILGMTGARAEQACAQTGSFQSRCMYHALLREEDILASQFPSGKEQELMLAILERMQKLGVEEVEEEPLYAILTARIIARRFEASWKKNRHEVFSASHCGSASANVCTNAYRISIKQIGRGKRPSNCSLPMQTDTVQAVGLPTWDVSFEQQAQIAWKSLCHINHGPKKPPDHSSSKRSNIQGPGKGK
jgi:hypothetical protein